MSDSSSPPVCDISRLKEILEEQKNLEQERIRLLENCGNNKKMEKMEKIEKIKQLLKDLEERLENEKNDYKKELIKRSIFISKERLKMLDDVNDDVSPNETSLNANSISIQKKGIVYSIKDGRIIAKGTRKKKGKASIKRHLKKLKKTR